VRGQAGTVLRWPLWSWRNLSITAAALLLVLFGMGRVIEPAKITLPPADGSGGAASTATGTASAAAGYGATPPALTPSESSTAAAMAPGAVPGKTLDPATEPGIAPPEATSPGTAPPAATVPASAPTPAGAVRSESVAVVATGFAQAWSASGRSQQEWTRGIQPFVTAALAAGLAQTDPARVPATKVTGEAVLQTASATSATVRVPTDGGGIVVTLTRGASTPWQVSDVTPAAQPPGAPTPDLQPRPTPAPG